MMRQAATNANFDADHGMHFQFISIKNLTGFFTIFSWTGLACLGAGKAMGFTVAAASVAGLA
ncbi:MAG: hypothetical protein HC896_08885 [Bacteroidales bacterium]|nr:hypothetical protein [Bacteroidales bacterium]